MYVCMYVYIYIYIYKERERGVGRAGQSVLRRAASAAEDKGF